MNNTATRQMGPSVVSSMVATVSRRERRRRRRSVGGHFTLPSHVAITVYPSFVSRLFADGNACEGSQRGQPAARLAQRHQIAQWSMSPWLVHSEGLNEGGGDGSSSSGSGRQGSCVECRDNEVMNDMTERPGRRSSEYIQSKEQNSCSNVQMGAQSAKMRPCSLNHLSVERPALHAEMAGNFD